MHAYTSISMMNGAHLCYLASVTEGDIFSTWLSFSTWEGQQQNGVANRYSDVVIEFGLDLFQSLTLIFSYAESALLVLKHRSSYFFTLLKNPVGLIQKHTSDFFRPCVMVITWFLKERTKQEYWSLNTEYWTLNLLKHTGSKMLNRWIKCIEISKKKIRE